MVTRLTFNEHSRKIARSIAAQVDSVENILGIFQVSGASGGSGCSVCALWNAGESALAPFNVASGDGAPAYMSLALDLVIRGIRDPLR